MNEPIIVICQHCGSKYVLGKKGTVMGCDECLGVIRNFEGMVIDEEYNFITDADIDTLTDMEKA